MIFTILYLCICYSQYHVWFETYPFILLAIIDMTTGLIGRYLTIMREKNIEWEESGK